MLEAYLVVPAFAAVYLLGAPLGWWKRLRHLAVAGGALLAVSLAWVLAVDLTPASARPYVGSSGTNSELTLALGYNGLQRLLGSFFTVARASINDAATSTAPGGPGGASENGAQGLFRLLNAQLGGQASWLLALGLIGALAAGWGFRPRGFLRTLPEHLRLWRRSAEAHAAAHLTPQQSALVLWGLWTLTMAAFFSVARFFHRYYLSMLAPGIAALAGVGVVLLWRDYRNAQAGWRGWLLPAALVATALTQAIILADYTGWNAWMTPLVIAGSLIIAGVLVWYRIRSNSEFNEGQRSAEAEESSAQGSAQLRDTPSPSIFGRLSRVAYVPLLAAVLGVGLLLVGPAMWTGVSLAQGAGGTLPSAGPSTTLASSGGPITGGFPGGFPGGSGGFPEGFRPGGGGTFSPPVRGFGRRDGGAFTLPAGIPGGRGLSVDSTLLKYLEAHQGSATYLFGTLSSQTAAPYIIVSGKSVMALGGFSGSDKILTLSQLKALIREGQIKYFLLSGGGFRRLGGGSGNSPLASWIEAHTTQVPASTYGGSTSGGTLYAVTSATVSAAQP